MRDAAREMAHALEPLRVVQRLLGAGALQAGGEQPAHRFEEADLVGPERMRPAGMNRQRAEDAPAIAERRRRATGQPRRHVARVQAHGHVAAVVFKHHGAALRQH